MRISCHTAVLLCLCLWIPVVKSEHIFDDDDEETSGYDFSGSGSGDDVEFSNTASTNTTKTAWVTDVPVSVTERTVTHLFSDVILLASVATAAPTTKFPLLHTTKVPETQPSPTSVKLHIQVKDELDVKTTTIRHADKEETTTLPAENPPLLPETTEQSKTTRRVEKTEEKSTVSVLLVKVEDGTTAPVEVVDHAVDEETTPLPLTTTSANEPADTDASGDNVESTTVLATVENSFIEENIIPEVNHELEKPLTGENDFHFEIDNEISKTRALQPQSGSALGSSSENENLLERKEVLAGVIAGGVVGLAFAIMLVSLMVYRMKKKDEGSYSLDEHKHPNVGYQKPQRQEEFLA